MLSLKFKEEVLEIEKSDGTPATLVVREMNGRDREDHTNQLSRMGKVTPSGDYEIKNYQGLTTLLLLKCLYWRTENGDTKLTEKEIYEFPSTAINELNAIANKVNGMTKKALAAAEEEAEKN